MGSRLTPPFFLAKICGPGLHGHGSQAMFFFKKGLKTSGVTYSGNTLGWDAYKALMTKKFAKHLCTAAPELAKKLNLAD